jgi:flavodoxin
MKTLIAYYSRTGNTRKAAEALARHMDADIVEIPCDKYDGGAKGLINAGHDSVHAEAPEIGDLPADPAAYDRVILGGPVWVWDAAPPLRSVIREVELAGKPVAVFVTYGGGPHGRPLRQLEDELGRKAVATAAFGASDLASDDALARASGDFAAKIDAAA